METLQKRILQFWIFLGCIAALFGILNFIFGFGLGDDVTKQLLRVMIILLGMTLSAIALDRLIYKAKIEKELQDITLMAEREFELLGDKSDLGLNKLNTILDKVSDFSSIEVLEGKASIVKTSIECLNQAIYRIRATSYKIGGSDSNANYYNHLADFIMKDNVKYECCFNEGHAFENRKIAFEGKLLESDYNKMEHYKFKNQAYFNFLIFDDTTALIGFPTNSAKDGMKFVIKLSSNNPIERKVIKNLINWYDEVLKKDPSREKVNIQDIFEKLGSRS